MPVAPPPIDPRKTLLGFLIFVQEQGVIGLAIGFILGGAVAKVVAAIVADLITPLIALMLGSAKGLDEFVLGPFKLGHLLSVTIDALAVALVVYLFVVALGLDKKSDASKEAAKEELKEEQKKSGEVAVRPVEP